MILPKRWSDWNANRPSAALLTLGLLLVATFAFGGSARGDEMGLIALRPISVIALLTAIYLVQADHIRGHMFWLLWLLSIVTLTVLHLVPLPPSLWHMIPGRELAVQLDLVLGTPDRWRPISLAPELTRNALWSMVAPLACFLLAIQLSRREMARVLLIVIVMGTLSGLLSVIQISQGPGSIAYFYRITNFGLGVGFFANRNHQAVLLVCMMPIGFGLTTMAIRANDALSRGYALTMIQWGLALGAVFVFMLVMVTGSRTGLGLYLVSLLMVFLFARGKTRQLFNKPETFKRRGQDRRKLPGMRYALVILPMLVIAALVLAGRDEAFKRLAQTDSDSEARFSIIDALLGAIQTYLPLGSGIGTFDPVFRIHEDAELLAPTYWNHAHNDWAELVLTGGLPAVAIVAAAAYWLFSFYVVDKPGKALQTDHATFTYMGGSVLVLTSLSSIVEYPLRVPIFSCIFVIAIAMISKARLSAPRREWQARSTA